MNLETEFYRKWQETQEINAELLAACKEALHQFTPVQKVPMDGLDRTRMWLRTAIAKAEGR